MGGTQATSSGTLHKNPGPQPLQLHLKHPVAAVAMATSWTVQCEHPSLPMVLWGCRDDTQPPHAALWVEGAVSLLPQCRVEGRRH